MNDAQSTELIKMLKKDTELSHGFTSKAWVLLAISHLLSFAIASYIGLPFSTNEYIALTSICVAIAAIFYFCQNIKLRLFSGFIFLLSMVFWNQILFPVNFVIHPAISHGELMCFFKGTLASSVTLFGTSLYFMKKNIAPTKGSVLLISFICSSTGTVAQAFMCKGGSFGHAMKSHLSVMIVLTVCTFLFYDVLKLKWMKSHK